MLAAVWRREMICHGGGAMVVLCRPVLKRLASNTDHLRIQLDQLHAEAESTRAKATSARLRLMRLSEAAEKLKRQAAISVNFGKENDARELLFQKKKVMQAMERSKNRIEFLDQLSSKLNQVISMKESQLTGSVASSVEVNGGSDSYPIWIVSPKLDDTNKDEDSSSNENLKFTTGQELCANGESSLPFDKELGSLSMDIGNEDSMIRGLKGITLIEEFLEHVVVQHIKFESELVTILNVLALLLNGNEQPHNSDVQQTLKLMERVNATMQKISRILQRKVEIS